MRPVNRPTATSSPPGASRTRALSDPTTLATIAPKPMPVTATIASAARWLGARPARCDGRAGAGAPAERGGIGRRGSARAVTEYYFGIDVPRNERNVEIHTAVLGSVPIQGAWQPNGRPPRWVASFRSSPARRVLVSVQPRWRRATGTKCWSVRCGCARSGMRRHLRPSVRGHRCSRALAQSPRAIPRHPLRPRLEPRCRLNLRDRLQPRSRRHRWPRFRRRLRLLPQLPRHRSRSCPARPSGSRSRTDHRTGVADGGPPGLPAAHRRRYAMTFTEPALACPAGEIAPVRSSRSPS